MRIEPPPAAAVAELVARALAEDLGEAGDRTSQATIPAALRGSGSIVARAPGTIAGLAVVPEVFARLDGSVTVELVAEDGERVPAGAGLARVEGPVRALLAGERTALNLLGRLSGIATATRALVDAVAGTRAAVLDTRKTTPGLRALERYAVRCGGGTNHRFGLFDAILIKDNHVAAAGSVAEALRRAREAAPVGLTIECEIDRLDELEAAIEGGADVVLLDNFGLDDLRAAVRIAAGRVPLEASGGVRPETIRAIAEAGVDRISVGWITHSAPALDVALDLESA
jgi:nicotinate-nucleotide pyrophosphorylase (carboxylating)